MSKPATMHQIRDTGKSTSEEFMEQPLPDEPPHFPFAALQWVLATDGIPMNRAKTLYYLSTTAMALAIREQRHWPSDQSLVFALNMEHFIVLQPAPAGAGLVAITTAGKVDLLDPLEMDVDELVKTLDAHAARGRALPPEARPRP